MGRSLNVSSEVKPCGTRLDRAVIGQSQHVSMSIKKLCKGKTM